MTAFKVGLVLVLAIVATVVANVVLLGVATGSSEPVGKLTPRAEFVPASVPQRTVPAPVPTQTGQRVEPSEKSDD